MRLMSIISLAALASGSAIQKRASTSVGITNFQADCTPHGTSCSYSFKIVAPGDTTSISCSGTAQSDGVGVLPITSGTCSGSTAWTWFTVKTSYSTNLFFDVQWTSPFTNDIVIFCYPIPQNQVTIQNDGASTSQHYNGPASFTADRNGCS